MRTYHTHINDKSKQTLGWYGADVYVESRRINLVLMHDDFLTILEQVSLLDKHFVRVDLR